MSGLNKNKDIKLLQQIKWHHQHLLRVYVDSVTQEFWQSVKQTSPPATFCMSVCWRRSERQGPKKPSLYQCCYKGPQCHRGTETTDTEKKRQAVVADLPSHKLTEKMHSRTDLTGMYTPDRRMSASVSGRPPGPGLDFSNPKSPLNETMRDVRIELNWKKKQKTKNNPVRRQRGNGPT